MTILPSEGKRKQCCVCKEHKCENEFHKNKSKKDGLDYRCKECKKEQSKYYYIDNKEHILRKNKIWSDNNREQHRGLNRKNDNKRYLSHLRRIERYMTECVKCGTNDDLLFHHPNDDKKYNVSDMDKCSMRLVIYEISKCEVMCRSCHQVHHVTKDKGFCEVHCD